MRYIVELNPRQSARVLDQCVRAGSQILVELAGNTVQPVPGRLISADESILLACLNHKLRPQTDGLVGRYVDVQIFTDPRHCFTTHIVEAGHDDEPNQIALRRPDVIQIVQRRRSWRAKLAPSSSVSLRWNGPDGDAIAREGRLLNLSADGLACRMNAAEAAELFVGDHLDVRFDLPQADAEFEFAATVTNRTPGSEDAVILGMQFLVLDDDLPATATQQRLRECLYSSNFDGVSPPVGT